MEIDITDTIRTIKEEEWNALAGAEYVDRSHAWYRTVEDSGMRTMYYVVIKEGGKVTAAASCFPYLQRIAVTEIPFLEVGAPMGNSATFFSKTPEHTAVLMEALEEIQARKKLKGLMILDLSKEEFARMRKQIKGFTSFPMRENTYIDLGFLDFQDYLSSLSRNARGSVRNTLNKAQKRWNIKTVVTNEFSEWKDTARNLQRYTCEQHRDYRGHLTEKFYEALELNLKDKAELLVCLKDDIPLVFGISLNSPTVCQCKISGADPHYMEYQAYFYLYYEEIRRAIERKQKRIYFGLTSYEFKKKVGCKMEERLGFVKMRNPLLDMILKAYVTVSARARREF